jgi:hypothetical protein
MLLMVRILEENTWSVDKEKKKEVERRGGVLYPRSRQQSPWPGCLHILRK